MYWWFGDFLSSGDPSSLLSPQLRRGPGLAFLWPLELLPPHPFLKPRCIAGHFPPVSWFNIISKDKYIQHCAFKYLKCTLYQGLNNRETEQQSSLRARLWNDGSIGMTAAKRISHLALSPTRDVILCWLANQSGSQFPHSWKEHDSTSSAAYRIGLLWKSNGIITHVKNCKPFKHQKVVILIVINSHSLWETESLCERHDHMLSHARFGAHIHCRRNIQIKILNSRVNCVMPESNIFIFFARLQPRKSPLRQCYFL